MAKLAFITGAASGLGQALAWRYHLAGAELALVGRRPSVIKSWAEQRGISPDCYKIYSADVAVVASIVAAGEACLRQQGVPDVVAACAGISIGVDTAERADLDVMALTYATNNVGTAATFMPFIKAMRQRRYGTLVGIGSVNGIRGLAGHGASCASKAALISYCESLRLELRGSGVQVVTLCPGYVATPLTQGNRFGMPFLLQPQDFAERAYRAIEAGASYRAIPWRMGVVAKLLRLLPNPVFDRLFAGRQRKARQ